jgi:hypothetical protein
MRAKIKALIGKMNAKHLLEHAAVVLDAVSRALERSLASVTEVMGLEDAHEAADLHTELTVRQQE